MIIQDSVMGVFMLSVFMLDVLVQNVMMQNLSLCLQRMPEPVDAHEDRCNRGERWAVEEMFSTYNR